MNTTSYKHSVLGLVLLSLMSFDAFAETRGSWFSGKHHSGQVTLDAAYGDKQTSHGTVDLLYPLYERSDAIGFVDVRGMLREGAVSEFNLGGGYRWLNESQSQLYGVYGFYDVKQSTHSKNYSQLTVGGEWKMAEYSLGGNVYIPMGSQKNELSRKASSTAPELVNNPAQSGTFVIQLTDDVLYEYAYQGLDVEAGYQVPQLPGLTTYVGAYHFTHKDADAITGPRLSVEYDVLQHIKQVPSWLDSVDVVASVQHDAVRETLWSVGMRVRIPLGSQASTRKVTGLKKALTSVVRRDIDIVTSALTVAEKDLFTKSDGTPYVGKIVTTSDALLDVTTRAKTTGLAVDIVAVAADIQIGGKTQAEAAEGLLTTTATRDIEAAVVLSDGQKLTGDTLTISYKGNVYEIPVVEKGVALAGALGTTKGSITLTQEDTTGAFVQTGHLIRVGKNNTIQDISLIVPAGDAAKNVKGQQSAAITNTKGIIDADENVTDGNITYTTNGSHFEPFDDLTLTNVDVTGGGIVYFNVKSDAATESTVTITGGKYEIVNPYVGRSYATGDDGIRDDVNTQYGAITLIDQGNGTKLGKHQLTGMMLSAQQALAGASYTYNEANGDEVTANETPAISGIALSYLSESGSISHNSITGINATGTGVGVSGVYVAGSTHGTIGCAAAVTSTDSCKNSFGAISATGDGATAYGIRVGDYEAAAGEDTEELIGTLSATGKINGNEFGAITSEEDRAYGIKVFKETKAGSEINNNTFKGAITSNAPAEVAGENNPNAMAGGIVVGHLKGKGEEGPAAGTTAAGIIAGNTFDAKIKSNLYVYGTAVWGALGDGTADSGIIGCPAGAPNDTCKNSFADLEGIALSSGVFVFTNMAENSVISDNLFNTISSGSFATGITVEGMASNSVISDNKFTTISTGFVAFGIAVNTMAENSTISHNSFTSISSTDGEAYGVQVINSMAGTIGCGSAVTSTESCKNTFGTISAGADDDDNAAYGISIGDYEEAEGEDLEKHIGTLEATGKINGNEFAGITSEKDRAHGIKVFKETKAGSEINNNTFKGAITSNAPAAVAGENNPNAMAGGIVVGHHKGEEGPAAGTTAAGTIAGNTFDAKIKSNLSVYGTAVWGALGDGTANSGIIGCPAGAPNETCKNSFADLEGSISVAGIVVVGMASNSVISHNSFTSINADAGVALGIFAINTMASNSVISHNSSTSINTGDGVAAGVAASNMAENSTISHNSFTSISSTDGEAYGVQVINSMAGTIGCGSAVTSTDSCKNTFGTISAGGDDNAAYGIRVGDYVEAEGEDLEKHIGTLEATGKINGNEFAAITSGKGRAHGIKVFKETKAGSEINNNTFKGAITSNAPAAVAGENNPNAMAGGIVVGHHKDEEGPAAGTTAAGTIAGNTFDAKIKADYFVYGTAVWGALGDGTAESGIIGCPAGAPNETCKNSFADLEGSISVAGIVVMGMASNSVISHNSFTSINTGDRLAFGIYVTNTMPKNSTISHNSFTSISSTDGEAYGVDVGESMAGTIGCGSAVTSTESCKNTFGTISVAGDDNAAYGIIVGGYEEADGADLEEHLGTLDATGKINGNEFAAITSEKGRAYGIKVFKETKAGSEINNNTFTGTITSNAALVADGSIETAGISIGHWIDDADKAPTGTTAAGTIAGNTFEMTIKGQNYSEGITIYGAASGVIGCASSITVATSGACKNSFTNITSTAMNAYGLYVYGASSGVINYNDFTVHAQATTQKDYGINFNTAFANAAHVEKVTNNSLVVTASGTDKAFGISLKDGTGFEAMKKAALANKFNGKDIDGDEPANAVEKRG